MSHEEPGRQVENVDVRAQGEREGLDRKLLSDRAQERAETWLRRIEEAQGPWEDNESERLMYRDAEEGTFPIFVPGAATSANVSSAIMGGKPEEAPTMQVVLNLVSRVIRRSKGKAFDDRPVPRFPRRTAETNDLCAGVERILEKVVVDRGGIVEEFRDGVSDVSSEGGFGMFIGMPWIPTRAEVEDGAKGGEDAIDDAQAGEVEPGRYRDTRSASGALLNIVADPDEQQAGDPEQVDPETGKLAVAAQEFAEAADAEATSVARVERCTLEIERLRLGEDLIHDPCSGRKKHWRWMARKVSMTRREAFALPSMRAEWVNRLPAWKEDADQRRYVEDPESDPDVTVMIWEVWDKWNDARHLVCPGVEGYGEADEANPYVKRDGSGPSIRGFFPFALCVPNKTANGRPIPGARAYWQQQVELIIIDSAIVAMVKRAAQDVYGCSSEEWQVLQKALKSHAGGVVVPFAPDTNMAQAFQALKMVGPLQEVIAERQQKLVDLSIAANFPLSELTSQPQADTLGQERIASAAGQSGVGDEVAQYAVAMGECFDIAWDLIREHWTVEDVNAEMGADLTAVWDTWAGSSLSDERVTVELGSSASDDDPERAERIMAFVQSAAAIPSQKFPGFPAFDVVKMMNMASHAIGLGELPPFQPSPEQIAMQQATLEAGPGPGAGGGGPPGGGNRPAHRRGQGGRGGSREAPGASQQQKTEYSNA